MENRSLTVSMLFFLAIFHLNGCLACLETERIALLDIKASLNSTISDYARTYYPEEVPSHPFGTWTDDKTSDCCAWEQVMCDNTSGRVVQLSLEYIYSDQFLNASLFLPFQDLQHLDLSENGIKGWRKNEGFEKLSKLKRLQVLDLGGNYLNNNALPYLGTLTSLKNLYLHVNEFGEGLQPDFGRGEGPLSKLKKLEVLHLHANYINDSFLPYLGALKSLKTLNLADNRLEGSSPEFANALTNLSNLEVLRLTSNGLNAFLPFNDLTNMSKLKILDLSVNAFSGKIPSSVLSLHSLEALSLNDNHLKDTISGICDLKNLQELDLSENKLEGILPPCLNNLTTLRMIDLSSNQLRGNIPPSLISTLKSLEFLSLSENHFDSTFSFTPSVDQKFQLRFLELSRCQLHISTTDIFKFLHNQYDLRYVDLSHNNLHGNFPDWLIKNNTRLVVLNLRNNSINGHVQFLRKHDYMLSLDISNNHIEGKIQPNVGYALPKLTSFNFSNNELEGIIPPSLGNMKTLYMLDLSGNNLSGQIPQSLALGCRGLWVLILSNNRLDGQIPPGMFYINLFVLDLHNNHFTSLPAKIKGSQTLEMIDISQNHLSGQVPTWMANLGSLKTLSIRDNYFDGSIPAEFCNSSEMTFLDFSQNHLSGSIPSCLISSLSLRYLHLQENKLTGLIPNFILNNASRLLTLDLKHNQLSGNIPNSIGGLSNLRILLLRGNHLNGSIPRALCKLNKIGILDLSHNNLSGTVPLCFSNLTFGKPEKVERAFELSLVLDGDLDIFSYNCSFEKDRVSYSIRQYAEQEEVEFLTKSRPDVYKGDILNFMAGLDLSCNNFTGNIPLVIGALSAIRALNLSYNQFTGPIPENLSNLKQIESVDLSHNRLSGEIPSELTGIYTLAVFIVAYNNLSGRIPDTAQFSTFVATSYEGNSYLCGPPLRKECNTPTTGTKTEKLVGLGENYGIDLISTVTSFAVSYLMTLLGLVIVLWVNPYWRRLYFDFINSCLSFMFSFCSYFKDL